MQELAELRKQIETIDSQLVDLINHRFELAKEIGVQKSILNLSTYDPRREHEVLQRIMSLGSDKGMPSPGLIAIFRELLSVCLAVQKPNIVLYLGPGETHTLQAARKSFGENAQFISAPNVFDLLEQLQKGGADFAVLPLENSSQGIVYQSLKALEKTPFSIHCDVVKKIEHNLLVNGEQDLDLRNVKKIFSHVQAINQCQTWIQKNVPQAELVEFQSTTQACLQAKEKGLGVAAIASFQAQVEFGMLLAAPKIQDQMNNETRFLVLESTPSSNKPKSNRCACILSLNDEPGSLAQSLEVFSKLDFNLARISSFPSYAEPWKMSFFVELVSLIPRDSSFVIDSSYFSRGGSKIVFLGFFGSIVS
jgi:chorismate mutase/prephenate dehydratase